MLTTEISLEDATEFLDQWEQGQLISLHPLSGGWTNSNYRLDRVGASPLVLKIVDTYSPGRAKRVAELTRYAASRGIPTPAPIESPRGEIQWVRDGKAWILSRFVQGHYLDREISAYEELGSIMARLHELPVPSDVPTEVTLGLEAIDRVLDGARHRGDHHDFVNLLARERRELEEHLSGDLRKSMIHSDLFADNILIRNGSIAAILDFECVCLAPCVLDLAFCIVGTAWHDGRPVLERIRALLSGYESRRPLSTIERQALEPLHRLATLGTAAWRYWKFRYDQPDALLADRYQEMVRRLELDLPLGN